MAAETLPGTPLQTLTHAQHFAFVLLHDSTYNHARAERIKLAAAGAVQMSDAGAAPIAPAEVAASELQCMPRQPNVNLVIDTQWLQDYERTPELEGGAQRSVSCLPLAETPVPMCLERAALTAHFSRGIDVLYAGKLALSELTSILNIAPEPPEVAPSARPGVRPPPVQPAGPLLSHFVVPRAARALSYRQVHYSAAAV